MFITDANGSLARRTSGELLRAIRIVLHESCGWGAGRIALLCSWLLIGAGTAICADQPASVQNPVDQRFPGASHIPDSQPGWQNFQTKVDPAAAKDEPQGGKTSLGTPVAKRIDECFPAESRNLFWKVDRVASGPGGKLEPLRYGADQSGKITDQERNAIRGQNTWMLWGEGNEAFWGWLQERGYGLVDFLILLDSRRREQRFHESGLMNQPGLKKQTDPARKILGLYLDQADGEKVRLVGPPAGDLDENGKLITGPPKAPPNHPQLPFKLGDEELYRKIIEQLPKDGVDYTVYGYPSGVVGLRWMPNPDFFGDGKAAANARAYWNERVTNGPNDAYYNDLNVSADPKLVRPFRPSMACAFCHVGPHPLAPPANPESPAWENLSSIIGNQYWSPKQAFANLTRADNFLHHFLASQQPGTIDTSLVSTDHINNPNTINSIFELPARLERAAVIPPERQSPVNLLLPGVEDGNPATNPRHTPRVLLDGADSIGVFGALSRVYLNIGTFPEEWSKCHNPIIGFKPQRPFSIATCDANSVYWRSAEKYRIPYLAAFFTLKNRVAKPVTKLQNASNLDLNYPSVANETTAPMKLVFAPNGRGIIEKEKDLATAGRKVFLQNCAVCHSSKQPPGVDLVFSLHWRNSPVGGPDDPLHLTLPTAFADWELFKKTAAYQEYVRRITELAGATDGNDDPFVTDNYLATDVRVPITLVGTNSGRSVGTNGMRGQIWDNFSSEDYKDLPAVGPVRFYNPYSGVQSDSLGFNDEYYPPGGGVGYYRPASLVSLWATAPYLHNNSLGLYNQDPSVEGRLAAFQDGITKLLWNSKRVPDRNHVMGDLRWEHLELTKGDTGFVYRTTQETYITIPANFIRALLVGVIGPGWTDFLSLYLWLGLTVLLIILTLWGEPRVAGFLWLLLGVLAIALLAITRFDRVNGWLWLLPIFFVAGALGFWFFVHARAVARLATGLLAILTLIAALALSGFVAGRLGALSVGPIPAGTPVNLVMNINPEAPQAVLLNAGTALLRGSWMVKTQGLKGEEALRVFESEAGAALLKASKCPDFVLDRGHWFGEAIPDEEKHQLIAFLRTL